jgi:hypothetical protein
VVKVIEMLMGDQHQIDILVLFRGYAGYTATKVDDPVSKKRIGEDMHAIHLDRYCGMSDISDDGSRFQKVLFFLVKSLSLEILSWRGDLLST